MESVSLVQVVSENIQLLMSERDMNAAEIARRASLNPTAIYDILKGKIRNPRLDTVEKIAFALGVPTLRLLQKRSDDEIRDKLLSAYEALPLDERARLVLTAEAWLGISPLASA